MNKSMKCIILIFAVIMIMVITGLGFCKGRNQEKITKEKKIEKAENGEKTTKYVNNEVTKDKQTGIYYVKNVILMKVYRKQKKQKLLMKFKEVLLTAYHL